MNRRKLLARLSQGHLKNVAFSDMINLVEAFGFRFSRRSGSHHIYTHPDLTELVNLQEAGGQAKPYQVRQFLRIVERYSMSIED
ncbi:MAG: type II toxin-antitoxin system HicA family toxin [Planctomycetes bacterium]|nr:type II toxin-antitoxin system HicA family toxin [Planctomycetota bacterium]